MINPTRRCTAAAKRFGQRRVVTTAGIPDFFVQLFIKALGNTTLGAARRDGIGLPPFLGDFFRSDSLDKTCTNFSILSAPSPAAFSQVADFCYSLRS